MEPTSFHTGPNKSRGQIHGAAAAANAAAANAAAAAANAAAAGDDTCVDSAFLISTVIFKKKKNTHTRRVGFGQKWQALKEMWWRAVMKPLTVDYPH